MVLENLNKREKDCGSLIQFEVWVRRYVLIKTKFCIGKQKGEVTLCTGNQRGDVLHNMNACTINKGMAHDVALSAGVALLMTSTWPQLNYTLLKNS